MGLIPKDANQMYMSDKPLRWGLLTALAKILIYSNTNGNNENAYNAN